MKRLLPPSRTEPMDPKASYFERLMRVHFQEVNGDWPSRRIPRRSKIYWDATVYGAGIMLLLVLLGIFGDI